MATTLHHRGPAPSGYCIPDNLGPAHTRLALLWLGECGAQAVRSGSGDWAISFRAACADTSSSRLNRLRISSIAGPAGTARRLATPCSAPLACAAQAGLRLLQHHHVMASNMKQIKKKIRFKARQMKSNTPPSKRSRSEVSTDEPGSKYLTISPQFHPGFATISSFPCTFGHACIGRDETQSPSC